jgi:hypothetical protein
MIGRGVPVAMLRRAPSGFLAFVVSGVRAARSSAAKPAAVDEHRPSNCTPGRRRGTQSERASQLPVPARVASLAPGRVARPADDAEPDRQLISAQSPAHIRRRQSRGPNRLVWLRASAGRRQMITTTHRAARVQASFTSGRRARDSCSRAAGGWRAPLIRLSGLISRSARTHRSAAQPRAC